MTRQTPRRTLTQAHQEWMADQLMTYCPCDLDCKCAYHQLLDDYLTTEELYMVRFYPDSAKAHAALIKAFALAPEEAKIAAHAAWPEGPAS